MSINERKHANIVETKLDLNESQSTAFNNLRTKLGAAHNDYNDYSLYRFLKKNDFKVDKAAENWLKYLEWRKTNNIDNITKSIPAGLETMKVLTPHAYHFFDKENRPIYWEKTGKLKCEAVADPNIMNPVEFLNGHIWGMEHVFELAHQKSLELGKRIDTFTSILDMDGLGFSHRAAMPILKSCMDIDDLYYPERIGKLYVLNTPWVAPALFSVAQPLLPAAVKDRMFVVKGEPGKFLVNHIEKKYLPAQYGGECTCSNKQGGCIPELDATEIIKNAKKVDGLDVQVVKNDFKQELTCDEKGGTFTWFFQTDGGAGYDVDFSVAIYDLAQPNKPPIMAKPVSRCCQSKGSYESPGAAKLIFLWDNKFSYFTNKTIHYTVSVVDNAALHALESASNE